MDWMVYFPERDGVGSNIVVDIVEECTYDLVVLVVDVKISHTAGRGCVQKYQHGK